MTHRFQTLLALSTSCAVVLATLVGGCAADRPAASTTPPAAGPTTPATAPESHPTATDRVRLRRLATATQDLSPHELEDLPPLRQARLVASCASLSWGDYYCLGLGYRSSRPDYRALLADRSSAPSGDLSFSDWVAQRVTMPATSRVALQRSETKDAAAGLDKARALADG